MIRSLALAFLAVALLVPPASAQQPITPLGSMLRLTTTGPEGDAAFDAERPGVALDHTRNRMFMVYDAVDPSSPPTRDVWGVVLNADGSRGGAPVKLAAGESAGVADDTERPSPAIAYSAIADGYLVAYSAQTDGIAGGHHEIRVLRLNPDGVVLSGPTTISTTGPGANDPNRDAIRPAVAADTEAPGFLVVWEADDDADNSFEIYSRRVDGGGQPVGVDDSRVSNTGFAAYAAHAVYVPSTDQYVVAWSGDAAGVGDDRVYLSPVEKAGGLVGAAVDITDGSASVVQDALGADLTYNPTSDEIVVAFLYELADVSGLANSEVFVQRVGPDLAERGEETRISTVNDESNSFNAEMPRIAYLSTLDRYLVTWRADGAAAGQAEDEHELYMQVLNGADAAEIGGDVRLTQVGTDADASADVATTHPNVYWATRYQVVANPATREWVVVFPADKAISPLVDEEWEIFSRRVGVNTDFDGDGVAVPADCDDSNAAIRPGATDVPDNGVDEDCAGGDAVDLDRDRDGSPRPADCNDGNRNIRPGLVDVPGNRIDEDCSGADAVVAGANRVEATVAFQFSVKRGRTTVRVLRVNKLLGNEVVEVRCSGKGCKAKRKVFRIRRPGSQNVQRMFRRAALRNRARIEIRITRPGAIGKVVRFPIRRRSVPKSQVLCLPIGSRTPRRTC